MVYAILAVVAVMAIVAVMALCAVAAKADANVASEPIAAVAVAADPFADSVVTIRDARYVSMFIRPCYRAIYYGSAYTNRVEEFYIPPFTYYLSDDAKTLRAWKKFHKKQKHAAAHKTEEADDMRFIRNKERFDSWDEPCDGMSKEWMRGKRNNGQMPRYKNIDRATIRRMIVD